MAENEATPEAPTSEAPKVDEIDKETATKPLKMSFADWKKSKEAKEQSDDAGATRNGRKLQKNDHSKQPGNNRNHMGNNNNNNNINNNNSFPPLSRPPPLPFPLMSMGFGNFGPGPGPCGPQQMMPPSCNMGNMGPGPGPRNHRPLQPPPFWEDMMSPQHRPPPIQPPMPKCPSLWNLVPKEKQANQRQHKHNHNHSHSQNSQPNKKYKASNNNSNNSNNNNNKSNNNAVNNALLDAALMPPPPPPGGSSNSNNTSANNSAASNKLAKKKVGGGTFVQIDGKWVQRPEAPPPLEDAPPGTKEDRQRQWREYRQAMKPFKNREFHNWKRTVQRLSKLPRDQLDDKQLERLQKAEEYIGAHKAMLTIKHAEQWVQQANLRSEPIGPSQGQIFVRKTATSIWHKSNENTGLPIRKQPFGAGRAIKGGIGCDVSANAGASPMGQFSDIAGGWFGQPYNSNPYGLDMAASSNSINSGNAGNSNSFYANYSSNFIKGNTFLPP